MGSSAGAPAGASSAVDVRVSVGGPHGPYARNSQNEPSVAVDPAHPDVLVAGANDLIDEWDASVSGVPEFAPSVRISGVYFSFDRGTTWTQPTYSGTSARSGSVTTGPIGTLPGYDVAGLETDGDPSLAFGPRPGADGRFSWANGSRLYYANLADSGGVRSSPQGFHGLAAVAVSRTDDPARAGRGGADGQAAWMPPAIVTQSAGVPVFNDKEAIWADNAASSPSFGNVYTCWVAFRNVKTGKGGGSPDPLMFSRSTDGGTTWAGSRQLSAAVNNSNPVQSTGRQGCAVRTDSHGTVYVAFLEGHQGVTSQMITRSFDGGRTFERPRAVATISGAIVGDYDGVAGWEKNAFPSLDVANGAPTGSGGSDQVLLAWSDSRNGTGHEEVLVTRSTDRGASWSAPSSAAEQGDRPLLAAIAISPNGKDAYLTYDSYLEPPTATTATVRHAVGVVRHADISPSGTLGSFSTVWRAPSGDARAITFADRERWGDYNSVVATNSYGFAAWNDVRNAVDCPVIDAYRMDIQTDPAAVLPTIPASCDGFGDSDIYGVNITDPTP